MLHQQSIRGDYVRVPLMLTISFMNSALSILKIDRYGVRWRGRLRTTIQYATSRLLNTPFLLPPLIRLY